jgi:hypothetical protein
MNAVDPRFDDVVFMIEADSFAQLHLWSEFSSESKRPLIKSTVHWEQDTSGFARNVGNLQTMTRRKETLPVMCEVFFAKLEGFRVAFYSACSRAVDWELVHGWMRKQCPGVGKCDAQNFHLCLDKIRELATCSAVHDS